MKIPGSGCFRGFFLSLPEDSVLNERPWMKMSFGTGKQQFPHRGIVSHRGTTPWSVRKKSRS